MTSIPPPGTNVTAKKRPVSAKGRSAFAPSTVTIGGGSGNVKAIEGDLVTNLKEQIACLELELTYVKDKKGSPAASSSMAAKQPEPILKEATAAPTSAAAPAAAHGSVMNVSSSQDFRATHAELLNHAGVLEKEVITLRKRFAEREKEHHLELAHAKAGVEVHGVATSQNAPINLRHELAIARGNAQRDLSTIKEAHAQEVVTLQKTIERVNIEYQSHHGELQAAVKERDALLRDLTVHKEELRNTQNALDTLHRQYDEAHRMLSSEQEQRRKLENTEKELRYATTTGQQQQMQDNQRKIAALEARCTELNKSASVAVYEGDQAKITAKKLQDDINSLLHDKWSLSDENERMKANLSEAEQKIEKMNSTLTDMAAERDYFRLQVDRLKVDHSVLDVKCTQMEAKAESDKNAFMGLEKQYCTALETIDQLKREGKAKEKIYEQLDANDTQLRKANFVLTEELTNVRHTVDDLKAALTEINGKYEANRCVADQVRAEQQLSLTLSRLDKMKHEMNNLLGTQMRISQDITQSMMEVPDSSVVIRALTPAHPAGNQSGVDMSLIQQQPGMTPRPDSAPAVVPPPTAVTTANIPTPGSAVVVQTPSAPAAIDLTASVSVIPTAAADQERFKHGEV